MRLARHVIPGLTVLAVVLGAAACGPSRGDRGDDTAGDDTGDDAPPPDAYQGQYGSVSGRVWFPNQGPGQVPSGEEIPVFGAVVYVSTTRPAPIPQEVYCERCVDAPPNAVASMHDGSFQLNNILPGTYWFVIQKGQWRLERELTIGEGQLLLTDAETTLPSSHDPANGAWMPKMAIVIGTHDYIQDVLGKVGIGNYNANTHQFIDGGGEITVFQGAQSVRDLMNDIDLLRQFHIIFFPCNTGIDDFGIPELNDQTALANLRRYVNEGGKLYVTDWSGEMMDRPFPPQITLGGGVDSAGTYDPQPPFTGTLTSPGSANGSPYTSNDAEAVDQDLGSWLGLQFGPTPNDPTPTMYNPTNFQVTGNYNWISALASVQTGMDPEGLPVYDDPKAWVIGSGPSTGGQKQPLLVTFEPTGCGRVMFSTFQTATTRHAGIYPQERILLYLIAEIGVCSDTPIVD